MAGVIAGTSNNGGGSAPTVLTSFAVPNPKVSPATLRLGVSGHAPVTASLFYEPPGGGRTPMTELAGVTGNAVVVSDPGAELSWDFAAEPFLSGERFVDCVRMGREDGVKLAVEFPGDVTLAPHPV